MPARDGQTIRLGDLSRRRHLKPRDDWARQAGVRALCAGRMSVHHLIRRQILPMHSMTAFARVETQAHGYHLVWELKSVNHRFLETYFRIAPYLFDRRHQLHKQLAV